MLQSEFTPAARAQLAQTAVVAKRRKNLTWEQIAEGSGHNVAFVTAAILGQHPLPAETAKLVGERLDLGADDIQLLQSVPVRDGVGIPSDPTLYRFHAMMQMYGPTLKALVHEKFGDGIISAINFRLDIQKVPDPEGGDRAVITLNGKVLAGEALLTRSRAGKLAARNQLATGEKS